jgi:hypothetical protein
MSQGIECVVMRGSDTRLDRTDMLEPFNTPPRKCLKCGFPDLDFVPQLYRLIKSRLRSSQETAQGCFGNMLATDRVWKILEVVCPGQCKFYPTVADPTRRNDHVVVGGSKAFRLDRRGEEVDPAL